MTFRNSFRTFASFVNMSRLKNNTTSILTCKHAYEAGVQDDLISTAANFLQNGEIIAVPTDTIYGLAARVQSVNAVLKLYKIKHRDLMKPVAICVANISDIPKWAKVTIPDDLLSLLLPGPVTLVFERTNHLNSHLNPGVSLVGVRIPDYSLLRRIVEAVGEPLALTSANISAHHSSLEIKEFESIWPFLPLVVDGGKLGTTEQARLGSTVVDLSRNGYFRIIRDGSALEATKKKLLAFNLTESMGDFIS